MVPSPATGHQRGDGLEREREERERKKERQDNLYLRIYVYSILKWYPFVMIRLCRCSDLYFLINNI